MIARSNIHICDWEVEMAWKQYIAPYLIDGNVKIASSIIEAAYLRKTASMLHESQLREGEFF